MKIFAALLAAALVTAPAVAAPARDGGVLPSDGAAGGWRRTRPSMVFRGADLYGHINGGSEVFLELGFDDLVVQDYGKGDGALAVEVYTMRDELAAAGIYLLKCGREARHPDIPGRHAYSPRQVQLWRGRTYVTLTNFDGSEATTSAMVTFARLIAQRLPSPGPVPGLDALPAEGRDEASVRVIRGPATLETVYTLGPGDVLQLGGTLTAVAADYPDGRGGRFTRIVASYPDPARARAAFDHVAANLDSYIETVSRTPGRLVFKDWAGKFGEVRPEGSRLEILVNLDAPPDGG